MFVTLFSSNTGYRAQINLCQCRHNLLFYIIKKENLSKLMPTGMALGMKSHFAYREGIVQIDKVISFFSTRMEPGCDGTTKTVHEEELLEFIQRHRNGDPNQIVNYCEIFCAGNFESSSNDDLTIVVWKRIIVHDIKLRIRLIFRCLGFADGNTR